MVSTAAVLTHLQARVWYEGGRFLNGDVARLSAAERAAVDAYLVEIGHPLASEPGTQESRIVRYAKEIAGLATL